MTIGYKVSDNVPSQFYDLRKDHYDILLVLPCAVKKKK
jgi:hypothetical protein